MKKKFCVSRYKKKFNPVFLGGLEAMVKKSSLNSTKKVGEKDSGVPVDSAWHYM